MNKKRFIGFIFILISICIVVSNISITGAVIGNLTSNYLSLIAATFLIVGAALMVYETPQQRIEEIIKQYEAGQLDVIRVISELNRIVPIQGVKYRTGKQHTIIGDRNAYPIGLKSGRKAEELAMAAYLMAGKNNRLGIRQSNIEIDRGFSTKHYMKEFKKALENFKAIHAGDLEAVLGIPTA
jgi:uncharacterized protein (DUF486 family)